MSTPGIERLADWRWRISNLYTVVDENGVLGRFTPNEAQVQFLDTAHNRNNILKSRQLGFTTLIAIFALDQCLFCPNTSAGFISQDLGKAQETFQIKIRDVYDRLPDALRGRMPAKNEAARTIRFANGSRIIVDTSLRSGTYQIIHISELGKIAVAAPKKAREIKTGTLPTLHKGAVAFVESTAEGQAGLFYEMCEESKQRSVIDKPLTPLEFKFHFFPWWMDVRNELPADMVDVPAHLSRYFNKLEDALNDQIEQGTAPAWLKQAAKGEWVVIRPEQRAWYVITAALQKDDMKREYPSTPEEAFEAAIEGAFYKQELTRALAQGRFGDWPYMPALGAVYTFHDIGRGVHAVWWAQRDHGFWRFIRYREWYHGGVAETARYLQDEQDEMGFVYGRHYLPHDGDTKDWSADLKRADELASRLGVTRDMIDVVQRTKSVFADHQTVKNFIELSRIDRQGCAQGWSHLNSYRRAHSETLGAFLEKEDESGTCIHGADAFRTAAMADFHGLIMEDSFIGRKERALAAAHDEEQGRNERSGY